MEAEAESEAIRVKGEAEAFAIEAKARAEAEQMAKKADAWKDYQDAAMIDMVLETLPKVQERIMIIVIMKRFFNAALFTWCTALDLLENTLQVFLLDFVIIHIVCLLFFPLDCCGDCSALVQRQEDHHGVER
jgi:hypothetical protein